MTDTPRRLTHDDRRTQLLELGLRLFSRRAYDEVAIDDIAAEAGVSKGLLYHYFGGKRAFYIACVEEAASRLAEATAPDPALPSAERLAVGLTAYLDFVAERAEAYTALMRGGVGADDAVMAIIQRTRQRIVDTILEGLGLTTPRPAWRTAVRAWIGAVEAASLDWLVHGDLEQEALHELLLGTLAGFALGAHALDPDATLALDEEALGALLGGSAG